MKKFTRGEILFLRVVLAVAMGSVVAGMVFVVVEGIKRL
jgi:hypothetical protein